MLRKNSQVRVVVCKMDDPEAIINISLPVEVWQVHSEIPCQGWKIVMYPTNNHGLPFVRSAPHNAPRKFPVVFAIVRCLNSLSQPPAKRFERLIGPADIPMSSDSRRKKLGRRTG
jgi:hypothetical protein